SACDWMALSASIKSSLSALFRALSRDLSGSERVLGEAGCHATQRVFQKATTRSAVEGISLVKFARAVSLSDGAGTRFGPGRIRISARTVAHSRPTHLLTIRIGSKRSLAIRLSRVVIFTPDIAESAATDSS